MKKVVRNVEEYAVLEKALKAKDRVVREVIKEFPSSNGKLNDDSYNDLKNRKNKEAKFSFDSITIRGVFGDEYKTVSRFLPVNINIHIDKDIATSVFIGSVVITHSDEIPIPELFETYADTVLSGIITITDYGIELFNPGDEEANIFDKVINIENLTKEFGLYRHTDSVLSDEFFDYSEYYNIYDNQDKIICVVEKTQYFAKIYDDYYYTVSYNDDNN